MCRYCKFVFAIFFSSIFVCHSFLCVGLQSSHPDLSRNYVSSIHVWPQHCPFVDGLSCHRIFQT